MSSQTYQVQADTPVPVDRSIFNLSAVGSETIVETDFGLIPAKSLTTRHRLRGHRGLFVDIEWIEQLELNADDLNRYPGLNPVVIPAGLFGSGLPRRNTVLSPSQKLWAKRSDGISGTFGSARMLAPDPLAFHDQRISVNYIVLACSSPTMFNAEGMWLSC